LIFLLALSLGNIFPLHAQDSAENLINKTLANDIHTASYYELVPWCRDLGLDDSGTRQALQQRLYAYYRVSAPPAEPAPEGKTRLLEIKSAKETQYFTIEQVDEDYVLLLGDVLVEIKEEGATHRIRAHKILLNETENILNAEGGIEYTLIKGTEEEFFRGERLTFNVDSWEGVFFSGGMEADRSVGGETIRFRFLGESISRLEDNTVVIDRGRITSCDIEENPHYHIRARKIWVLAPNEWAILNAVLYVGRVPVLYLPFFFRPGDEFFFHPAIGYRNREGQFIQTTTYLIGQKKRSSSALSFLAATEESTTQYELERKGLFLRPIPDKPTVVEEDRFLKILLDLYSRLGGFAGVEGSFPKVDVKGGIGFSRTLYGPYGDSYYTPWYNDPNVVPSSWNKSYLFGLTLPFRFGVESSWNLGDGPYRLSGRFEYFSDPNFTSDFYNRAEDTGLTRLIGIEPIEETTEAQKGSLTWELNGRADFSDRFDTPFIKTMSFPYIKATLFWLSETNVSATDEEDPARKYFEPTSFKIPSTAFQMTGNLVDVTLPSGVKKRNGEPAAPSELDEDLRLPDALRPPDSEGDGAAPADTTDESQPDTEYLRVPAPKADVPVKIGKTPLRFQLSYQVRPQLNVEQSFAFEEWDEPQEVAYDVEYTNLETVGISSLDYRLTVLENVLLLSGNIAYTGSYKTSYSEGTWIQDHPSNQIVLRSMLGLDVFPLADDPIFSKTSLSYDIDYAFYRYLWDGSSAYTSRFFDSWQPETVGQHTLKATFGWRMFEADNSLSLTAQLRPPTESLTANLDFTIWLLRTTINSVFNETAIEDQIFPLLVRERLKVGENVTLTEELRFNYGSGVAPGEVLTQSLTSLNLWDFSASFTAGIIQPRKFDDVDTGWENDGDPKFLPSQVTVGFNRSTEERLRWKNRFRTQASVGASWSMNLEEFTNNRLDLSFSYRFLLHKMLEFTIRTTSYNEATFLYFDRMVQELDNASGVSAERASLLEDLWNSFRFFDSDARKASNFKLGSISVDAVHYLHDWNLILSYQGQPTLDEQSYAWQSSFSILLQWLPIPELRSNLRGEVRGDTSEFSLRG